MGPDPSSGAEEECTSDPPEGQETPIQDIWGQDGGPHNIGPPPQKRGVYTGERVYHDVKDTHPPPPTPLHWQELP